MPHSLPVHNHGTRAYLASIRHRLSAIMAMFCGVAAFGLEAPSLPDDGQALAAQLRSTPPPEDVEVTGRIRIRLEDGRRTSRAFRYRVLSGGEQWQQIFESPAAGAYPAQKLVIHHRVDAAPVHTLTNGSNDSGGIALAGDRAMIPFAGSDFWLADLGLDFLHWPEQRIDRSTRLTMRKGRSCRVLESVNPEPGAAGYTRVRSWVDLKTGGIIIAEAYDHNNRPLKEFEIGGFTKVNERWALKNMEIRNLQSDTRTVLEFHYEVEE